MAAMPPSKRKRLFLVDGMSQIYRAFYALPSLSNSKGFPTNAIYGFTMMLNKLLAFKSIFSEASHRAKEERARTTCGVKK